MDQTIPSAGAESNSSSDDDIASTSKKQLAVGIPSANGWNVFVSGLPSSTTESQIASVFTKQEWIRVNFDRSTGHCKGYAIIEYSDREQGQDAINRLHGSTFLGSRLGVHWAFVKKPGVVATKCT